jgi:integrase
LLQERLRIRLLPDPPKPLTPISDAEIRRLVRFRPHGRLQVRTWTLIVLLLDTGLRIDEALGLDRASVDLHNCVVRVRGKGNRERLVPISLECRKRLYVLLKSATADPVFPTYSGLRLTTRNAYPTPTTKGTMTHDVYRCGDFAIVTALELANIHPIGREVAARGKVVFTYQDSPQLQDLLEQYHCGSMTVSAKRFAVLHRELVTRIKAEGRRQ